MLVLNIQLHHGPLNVAANLAYANNFVKSYFGYKSWIIFLHHI